MKQNAMVVDIEKQTTKNCSIQVNEKEMKISDCRHREGNDITLIKDFN